MQKWRRNSKFLENKIQRIWTHKESGKKKKIKYPGKNKPTKVSDLHCRFDVGVRNLFDMAKKISKKIIIPFFFFCP